MAPTTLLTVTRPELTSTLKCNLVQPPHTGAGKEAGGGAQIGHVEIPPRRAAGFIASYQGGCMHKTGYYPSVFIRLVWNILEGEEWPDILKWDKESCLQCRILYCSVLHNLSEMKKK